MRWNLIISLETFDQLLVVANKIPLLLGEFHPSFELVDQILDGVFLSLNFSERDGVDNVCSVKKKHSLVNDLRHVIIFIQFGHDTT